MLETCGLRSCPLWVQRSLLYTYYRRKVDENNMLDTSDLPSFPLVFLLFYSIMFYYILLYFNLFYFLWPGNACYHGDLFSCSLSIQRSILYSQCWSQNKLEARDLNSAAPWTKELKDTNPLMSSLLVICLGWCRNFVGESGQKQSVKLLQNMVNSTPQFNIPQSPPPPVTHTVCLYSTFSLGGGEVGQRKGKVEGQQYKSIVPSSMGATVHELGWKYKPLSECISSP